MLRNKPTPGQAIRRVTLGSGPLKRTSDRLECLSRILLAAVMLTAVPIALAVATGSYTQGRSEVTAQAAERQQVPAELLEDASAPADASGAVPRDGRASAVWTGPSGAEHTDEVSTPLGARAGSTVSVWIDQNGDRTTRPLSTSAVVGRAVGFALMIQLAISMGAYVAHRGVRRLLDRGRSRQWAAEWAVVEPKWSGTVS